MTFFEAYTAMKAGAWIRQRVWQEAATEALYLFHDDGRVWIRYKNDAARQLTSLAVVSIDADDWIIVEKE